MSGSTLKSPNWTPASVGGNVILVTGASSGIGKATALILAEAGASLGLVDIQEPKEISDFINSTYGKERAIAVSCDVRNAQAITEATQKIVAALGPLNGAANLAGVIGKDREIGTTNGNLKGKSPFFLCSCRYSPFMQIWMTMSGTGSWTLTLTVSRIVCVLRWL